MNGGGRGQEIGIERVDVSAICQRTQIPHWSVAPWSEKNEIIDGVRLIAWNRHAGCLEARDGDPIPGAGDSGDQLATMGLGAVHDGKRARGRDPGSGVLPLPKSGSRSCSRCERSKGQEHRTQPQEAR